MAAVSPEPVSFARFSRSGLADAGRIVSCVTTAASGPVIRNKKLNHVIKRQSRVWKRMEAC